jgi:thiamine-phosphate pyrophosphorylase
MASRPKQAEPRPAPRLYLITPPVSDAGRFAGGLTAALGAADIAAVLLRLADSDERTSINCVKALAPVVQDTGAALLIEDRPDLVARSGADGAHLNGIDAFNAARERLKPERIAGAGRLITRHDAMVAAEAGADYISFGEPGIALAATKERVGWVAELFELPCVALANDMDEIGPLAAAGADFIALDFVWRDPRGAPAAIAEAVQHLRLSEPVP